MKGTNAEFCLRWHIMGNSKTLWSKITVYQHFGLSVPYMVL